MTFQDACRAILADPKANHYAQAYAHAALHVSFSRSFERVQALYILSNLKAWRHPDAKQVRATLRQIGEVK